jgi:PAS domain S-box-containing protein
MCASPQQNGLPELEFLAGGGEMGELIRSHRWSETPLGDPATWPQSLRSAVSMCTNARAVSAIYWGPEFRLIYNDGYKPFLDCRHPAALGQPMAELWPTLWQTLKASAQGVLDTGEGFVAENQRPLMERGNGVEETFWYYSFAPIRGESGAVDGIFLTALDTTGQALAERSLRAERERLRDLFRHAPGFMTVLRGPDHVFELTNVAYLQLIGHRGVLGKPVREALPEVEGQGYFELLNKVHDTREPFVGRAMPVDLQREPGARVERRFVDLVFQPILDVDGTVEGIFVEGSDVTERVVADAELRESEARYRALFEAIEAGFCVIELRFDEDGRAVDYRLTEINPAFEWQTGLVGAAGKWVSEVAPGLERHWFDTYGRVALTGEAVRFENRAEPFGRWYDVHAFRVGDPGAHRVAILFNDVSERRLAEERLRELNDTLEVLVAHRTAERDRMWDTSPDLMVVIDFEGVFRRVNPAWTSLLGYEPHELVDHHVNEYVLLADHAKTVAAFQLAAAGGLPVIENRYRHKDGSTRWISWVAAPDGGVTYAAGRDITADKARQKELDVAQEQLRQSQKLEAVGQLTGGVAHDFNNLLTIIKSSTDLLRRPGLPEERRRRYVDAISTTVERASKLTGQLLAFARRQALKPEVFDVPDCVGAIAEMMRTLVGARIEIETRLGPGRLHVEADVSQFETALVNLAVNARDAMGGEGTLTVRVEPVANLPALRGHAGAAGSFVAVSMTDTGSGIPAEELSQIFEPFYTTKEVGKGTGLGLSQVYGFVKQSGGDVAVESVVGGGTTFTLYLPQVHAPAVVAEATPEARVSAEGRGRRVLVVEDNVEVGTFSTQLLEDLGYVTTWAANGKEALELLEERDGFDVVFSDVVMPGMSGVELGQEIRRRYPGLPIVLTSGYSHILAEEGRHGFELLHKPYAAEELSRVLRRATRA